MGIAGGWYHAAIYIYIYIYIMLRLRDGSYSRVVTQAYSLSEWVDFSWLRIRLKFYALFIEISAKRKIYNDNKKNNTEFKYYFFRAEIPINLA